jgi:branched-chain amino acid transport system substrate-binding protein
VGEPPRPDVDRPATRDVVQTIYIRRCEMVNGKLWNVEFDKIENVRIRV